jgi:hypothetical protein
VLPDLLQSPETLRAGFAAGLERQLDAPGLGALILVLANAHFDADLWPHLAPRLRARFADHADRCRTALRHGQRMSDTEDDLLVFLKLLAIGFDELAPVEARSLGALELSFNPLRALRPPRASRLTPQNSQPPAFDAAAFHFNKPFLRPEILWEGDLLGLNSRLLYNKFPFAPLHGLLVPEPLAQRPQVLDVDLFAYASALTNALGARIPGWLTTYNSYGAYASVNHLHLQTAVRNTPLPVELPIWTHNGGMTDYPLNGHRFSHSAEAWTHVAQLQAEGRAFHVLWRPGAITVLPRRLQGHYSHADWSAGYAWFEAAGIATVFAHEDFVHLREDDLWRELGKLV